MKKIARDVVAQVAESWGTPDAENAWHAGGGDWMDDDNADPVAMISLTVPSWSCAIPAEVWVRPDVDAT